MKRPWFRPRLSRFAVLLGVLALSFLAPVPARAGGDTYAEFPDNPLDAWWQPGSGAALSDFVQYRDPGGTMGIVNAAGWLNTQGHPFFEPLGANGRIKDFLVFRSQNVPFSTYCMSNLTHS